MDYSGLAAADELDALNTSGDFEPAVEVDTVALDATIDALEVALEVVARLQALKAHLAAAKDVEKAASQAVEVAGAVEALAAITAAGIA